MPSDATLRGSSLPGGTGPDDAAALDHLARSLAHSILLWLHADRSGELRQEASLSLQELERQHLLRTLEQVGGNRTHAAAQLGISVRTLRNRIRRYNLPPRGTR